MSKYQMRRNCRWPTGLVLTVATGIGVLAIVPTPTVAQSPRTEAIASDQGVKSALQTIRSIQAEGKGFDAAREAADRLSQLPTRGIFVVLDAMRGADPVSQNWLRGIAGNIASKSGAASSDDLQAYIVDTDRSPGGRAVAMAMLKSQSQSAYERLLDRSLNDPSLLIREMAVARQLKLVGALTDEQSDVAKDSLRKTLEAARHPVQLASVLKKLNDLGDPVTASEAFAMIETWKAIGPFNNVNGVGFDEVYAPEAEYVANGTVELTATYEGKNGTVGWKAIEASGDEGKVDLAAFYDKEKGAVAYVFAEFESAADIDAQVRLGCICANQVWLNGKQVMSNEVYHSGSMVDQYTTNVQLVKGTNRILMKICQNEQTESWAQEWEFQCRVTDPTGKGLRPAQD